jgi:hypothetical protein
LLLTSSTKEKAWYVLQLTETTTSEVRMYPLKTLTLPQSHLYNALHIFACMKACYRKGQPSFKLFPTSDMSARAKGQPSWEVTWREDCR